MKNSILKLIASALFWVIIMAVAISIAGTWSPSHNTLLHFMWYAWVAFSITMIFDMVVGFIKIKRSLRVTMLERLMDGINPISFLFITGAVLYMFFTK